MDDKEKDILKKETLSLQLDTSANNIEAITKLNQLLSIFGIDVMYNTTNESVDFIYSAEILKQQIQKQHTKVGRKEKLTEYKTEDVKKMIKTIGTLKTIEMLGMSKPTFYAHLQRREVDGGEYF